MLDHDESFLVFSSVVVVAAPSIYDAGVYSKTLHSLHTTITIVYIVILIFYIVNSAMRATTSFKPYNPMKIWAGWGHDRNVHRYF